MSISRDLRSVMDRALRGAYGCRAWISGFGWLLNKDGELERFKPNILQDRILQALEICLANNWPVRIIGLKKRQGGLSTICGAIIYWLTRVRTTNSMVIGGIKWQSGNVWNYIRLFKDYDEYKWDTELKLGNDFGSLTNGSAMQKGTAKQPESCRSASIRALHCTEVARWANDGVANAERILTGALASIPPGPWTFCILESTAAGPTGMFYKLWKESIPLADVLAGRKPKHGQFIRVFAGWHEHADSALTMTKEEREELKSTLTDEEKSLMERYTLTLENIQYRRAKILECNGDPLIFQREYPFTPEEAFAASAPSFFPARQLGILRKWAERNEQERRVGLLQFDKINRRTILVPEEPAKAQWIQYEGPMPGCRYHIAADFMEGVAVDEKGDDRDHHCVSVWRAGYMDSRGVWRPMREVARTVKPCRWDPDIVEDVIEAAHHLYGRCMVVPENNKDGGIIRNLVNRGVTVYQSTTGVDEKGEMVSAKPSGRYGFRTTGGEAEGTRKAILNDLRAVVREIKDPGDSDFRPGENAFTGIEVSLYTVEEMEVFIRNMKGRAEAMNGQHDDSVITAAIANFTKDLGTPYVPSSHDLASFAISDPMARRQLGAQPSGWSGSGGGFGL